MSTTSDQVRNAPYNNSTSKAQYAFPKAQRFVADTKPNCTAACYELPSVFSKRGTTLGFGSRSDFTSMLDPVPAPNAYTVRQPVDDKNEDKKGFSFGLSREQIKTQGLFTDRAVPGPGAYNPPNYSRSTTSFSIRGRTKDPNAFATFMMDPGPGAYQIPDLVSKDGKQFITKFKSSGAIRIAPTSSRRFVENDSAIRSNPGPGAYQPKNDYSSLNKIRNAPAFTRGDRNPKNQYRTDSPGPCAYQPPSEFGHYGPFKGERSKSTMRLRGSSATNQDSKLNDNNSQLVTTEAK